MIKILLISFLFFNSIVLGQNLVPNPSFEDTVSCPSGTNDPNAVALWFNPTGATPDYYNSCASNGSGVPSNDWGYQFAEDGNAYIGIITYADPNVLSEYREYIEIQLSKKLAAGKKYFWCMHVSLLDSTDFASNNIGISLSNTVVSVPTSQSRLNLTVYDNHETVIGDNINWTKIGGEFVADGGEEYLILGNFFSDSQTLIDSLQTNSIGGPFAYYYIDNVYLGEESCIDYEISLPNVFTPNGDGTNDLLKFDFPCKSLIVYNRWGQKVFESTGTNCNWDGRTNSGKEVPNGTYFYIVTTDNETYTNTILLTK